MEIGTFSSLLLALWHLVYVHMRVLKIHTMKKNMVEKVIEYVEDGNRTILELAGFALIML